MEICAQEYLRTVLSKINLISEKKTEIILTNVEKEKSESETEKYQLRSLCASPTKELDWETWN